MTNKATTPSEKINLIVAVSSCHLVFFKIILLSYLYIDFILSILTVHEDLNTIKRVEEQGD
jgi:hypothetical protein